MARITQVESLTNAQMNTLLGTTFTSRQCFHAATGIEFWLTMAGPRGDHFDVTPTSEADARILENLIKRADLNRWTAEPIVIIVNGRAIGAGLSLFMHGSRMGRANPGSKYPSLSNTMPAGGWPRGGHICMYMTNSTGGAGDGTNPLVSTAANNAAGTGRGRQARAAAHEAVLLGRNNVSVLNRINSVLFPTGAPVAQQPVSTPAPTVQQAGIAPAGTVRYTVKEGENWGIIARRHNLTNAQLQALNPDHKNIDVVIAGVTVLNVPAAAGSTPAPAPQPTTPAFKEYNVRVHLNTVTSTLNIREQPNSNATTRILGSLRHNDERTVIEVRSGWLRVRHGNTIQGWISEQFTRRV